MYYFIDEAGIRHGVPLCVGEKWGIPCGPKEVSLPPVRVRVLIG
jgi:hypothetical protein